MRRHVAALAALCAAFAFAGPASALDVGVTEDEGNTNPNFVYSTLQDMGMTTNVMSMRWDPLDPLGLPANFNDIKAAAEVAQARGVSIILATYQTVNTGITDTPNAPAVFAAWLQKVAQNCPLCARKVIVLNEPNLQFFFKPTFDGTNPATCKPVSPAAYARVLAAAYDALKAVDSSIRVYGLGLSPRGNDRCFAASNVSMSPVRFLKALGDAYKEMGPRPPLMDALSFHPYPNRNDHGPKVGYPWPNIGVPNMDRLKQAFYDAFVGTAQPLIGIGPDAIKVALDELGWQVATDGLPGYTDQETVLPSVTEQQQADFYAETIALMACDPTVETLNFFHLRDEAHRGRFQSGMLRLDGSRRASYDAIKAAIAANRTCQGRPATWSPARGVIGGASIFGGKKFSKKQSVFQFQVTAQEDASYVAELVATSSKGEDTGEGKKKKKKKKKKKLSALGARVGTVSGDVPAYLKTRVRFKGKLAPGTYVFKVTLTAAMNSSRTSSFTSSPFTVK